MKRKFSAIKIDAIDNIIAPVRTDKVLFYVEVLLSLAKGKSDVSGSEKNQKGYFTMMNGRTGEILLTIPFGKIPEEKKAKYFKLSQEKAKRLYSEIISNPSNPPTTSYQSRCVEEDKYGGAILLIFNDWSKWILSFDGTTELKNEAMMMALADKLAMDYNRGLITQSEARGRNPYWTRLLSDFLNHELIVPMEKEMQKVGA
jgi:hypothetical protein